MRRAFCWVAVSLACASAVGVAQAVASTEAGVERTQEQHLRALGAEGLALFPSFVPKRYRLGFHTLGAMRRSPRNNLIFLAGRPGPHQPTIRFEVSYVARQADCQTPQQQLTRSRGIAIYGTAGHIWTCGTAADRRPNEISVRSSSVPLPIALRILFSARRL